MANGLARVHGTKAVRPGASNAAEEVERLQQLEQKAKDVKIGAWGINSASAVAVQPSRTVSLPSPGFAHTSPLSPPPARNLVPAASQPSAAPAQLIRTPPVAGSPAGSIAGDKLDINSASKEQLQKLPGIGEALADRIIAARPFSSADDLKKVKGVGEGKRYEQLRPYFR